MNILQLLNNVLPLHTQTNTNAAQVVMQQESNISFRSKVGLVMAAVGSAVGLGNIWKFPYIAGESGGGAFLLVYLGCVLFFGLPLLMTEFVIGKHTGKSVFGAFRALSGNNRWQWLGWSCLIVTIFVMAFYSVVTGWCINYLVDALGGSLMQSADMSAHFAQVSTDTKRMLIYSIAAIMLTACVLWFDINKGIERISKLLTPLLLLLMVLMSLRVLMLPDSNAGMRFLFEADFSKITPKVILSAMGQCFFSLSIGFGALITYGSYMPKRQNIMATSLQVAVLDTLVAVLAGVIIFPAVFAFGLDPAEGPELVFVVLPSVFEQMSLSWLSSVLFFGLLCIAAITSMISLMEVVVAFLTEATAHYKHPLNRHRAVGITIGICIAMCSLCVFSVSDSSGMLSIGGRNVFQLLDIISSYFLLPLNVLAISIFVGWFMPKSTIVQEMSSGRNKLYAKMSQLYVQIVRYLIPLAIAAIFVNELIEFAF